MAPTYSAHLYSYFRSSCSARVRTAAHLKGIKLTYTYIHLVKGEQHDPSYTALNPGGSVPTLIFTDETGKDIVIRQSGAILEFFEEYFPSSPALLPPVSDLVARAHVRELMNVVSCDIQPVTNLRILKRAKALGSDQTEWARDLMTEGLNAYDRLAGMHSGVYSVGDEITLADVVLAPAVEGALRFGVDLDALPTVKRIYERLRTLDAFRDGDWRHQPDTPEEFRVADVGLS